MRVFSGMVESKLMSFDSSHSLVTATIFRVFRAFRGQKLLSRIQVI
jgi:hypothetical protein